MGDHLETGRKGGEPPGGHGGTLALQDVKEELCVPPEPRKKRKSQEEGCEGSRGPAAGTGRAASCGQDARSQTEEEEKREERRRKGKGVGEGAPRRSKEAEDERQRWGPVELSRREPWGLVGRGQGGVLKLKRAFGALTEEVFKKAWRCPQDAPTSCEACRDGRGGRGDDGSQNDLVLQLDGPSLLQRLEPRHEGAQPSGYLPGRAAGGRIGEAGRFPCFPVPRHSYSRQRRHWKSAQYLELHPLEPTQGAPMSLLLEAKKHGRLVSKSQGADEGRWGR